MSLFKKSAKPTPPPTPPDNYVPVEGGRMRRASEAEPPTGPGAAELTPEQLEERAVAEAAVERDISADTPHDGRERPGGPPPEQSTPDVTDPGQRHDGDRLVAGGLRAEGSGVRRRQDNEQGLTEMRRDGVTVDEIGEMLKDSPPPLTEDDPDAALAERIWRVMMPSAPAPAGLTDDQVVDTLSLQVRNFNQTLHETREAGKRRAAFWRERARQLCGTLKARTDPKPKHNGREYEFTTRTPQVEFEGIMTIGQDADAEVKAEGEAVTVNEVPLVEKTQGPIT